MRRDLEPTDTPADITHCAHLYGLYSRNAVKLARLLHDQQADQADEDALQALLDETMEILEEMGKEDGKEK